MERVTVTFLDGSPPETFYGGDELGYTVSKDQKFYVILTEDAATCFNLGIVRSVTIENEGDD